MSRHIKGIFCLEAGEWYVGLRRKQSVEPALQLLNQCSGIPYIHRNAATATELSLYLHKWVQKKHQDFPILYLAFHGRPGCILAQTEKGRRVEIPLDVIIGQLEGKCSRRVIHFGACSALSVHGNIMNRYLRETGAVAISGYSSEVEWLKSSALDLLLFDAMQKERFTIRGLTNVYDKLYGEIPKLCRELDFRMVLRK